MKLRKTFFGFAFAITLLAANADYLRFDNVAAEVQEHVVDCITNCIRTATIAVMHDEPWDDGQTQSEQGVVSWRLAWRLGLDRRRCLVMFRGDPSVEGKFCYLYETPRWTGELPRLCIVHEDRFDDGKRIRRSKYSGLGCYFKDGIVSTTNLVWVRGKEMWNYYPPYDPYLSTQGSTTRLMLLTPQRELRRSVIKWPDGEAGGGWTGGDDRAASSQKIIEKLGIADLFDNRVFLINEGCAFHVSVKKPKGRPEVRANPDVIHLSQQELSEIVSLAFAVSKDGAGTYEDARRANPDLLLPVTECKTELGRRLRSALLPDCKGR